MKTVQKWLNEIDGEVLADRYFAEYPIDFVMLHDQNRTVAEIRRAARERFIEYVRKMRVVPIQQREEKTAVFYASKGHRDHKRCVITEMCIMEDVLSSHEPEHYSCVLTDHAKVMGYFIADTPLTQDNIEIVLAHILFETSFFGYDQEDLPDMIETLRRSEEDMKKGWTYTMEEMREHLGLPPMEPDEEAEALEHDIITAEYTYDLFCRRREEAKLRELFMAQASKERI